MKNLRFAIFNLRLTAALVAASLFAVPARAVGPTNLFATAPVMAVNSNGLLKSPTTFFASNRVMIATNFFVQYGTNLSWDAATCTLTIVSNTPAVGALFAAQESVVSGVVASNASEVFIDTIYTGTTNAFIGTKLGGARFGLATTLKYVSGISNTWQNLGFTNIFSSTFGLWLDGGSGGYPDSQLYGGGFQTFSEFIGPGDTTNLVTSRILSSAHNWGRPPDVALQVEQRIGGAAVRIPTIICADGSEIRNLTAANIASNGILPAIDGRNITNFFGAGYVSIGTFQTGATLRVTYWPTSSTDRVVNGALATGTVGGTNKCAIGIAGTWNAIFGGSVP